MSKHNDGGPAFPVVASNGLGHVSDGLTVRDYFAGQYLSGASVHQFCSGSVLMRFRRWLTGEGRLDFSPFTPESVSRAAYQAADAMLLERAK